MKSALLVIDIINSCCSTKCETPEWGITFKKIRKMVPKLVKFIDKYKKRGGEVIYINCTPWTNKHLAKNIVELYKDPKREYYSEDTTGHDEKFYLVEPEKGDEIFTKNTYDAFANPKLDKYLKKNKITNLIIVGIFSDGCVHATIQGGFSKGYNFVILKDLVETTDVKHRQQLQKLLIKYTWPIAFGDTITSETFLRKMKK